MSGGYVMKKCLLCNLLILVVLILAVSSICPAGQSQPWLGVHVGLGSKDNAAQLTEVVGQLADLGINAIVAEINYGFEYQSHPELRSPNGSNKEQIGKLAAECKAHHVRLIPQFQCLGHQSWSKRTAPLLVKYPQFDETPGLYANNEGIYCRSWCPLHPEVNPIIFSLMDELIDAFQADALHVGMDEVFLIGEDACSRCKGKDKAELFAKAVNDYHKHLVEEKKVEMLMWGDRLIDAGKIKYGKWEGFRVWPASWKKPEVAKAFVDYSKTISNPRMLGHLNTTWGAVRMKDLPTFEPLVYATSTLKPK
jgi:hypothetical protein